ncbi:DNA ligase [Paraburkholderia sp. RCC_158]|uniref:ATP-dependent DNA ligase n=1 Tax=Paraburkholderia sp. RCC_158 TaxID=3239220 RepID=UPI00352364EE
MSTVQTIEAADLMLATLWPKPFSRKGWLYELKYDGYRCLVRKRGGAMVDLITRNGNLLNRSFPDIVAAVAAVPGEFVWDAELTVDESNGRSSFERLQTRARTSVPSRVRAAIREHPARLYVFDMLAENDRDIRQLPLIERKQILRDSFDNTAALVYVNGIAEAGEWVFEQVQAHDFEGMVGKRLDAPYQRGRTRDWLKVKYPDYSRQEALGFGRAAKETP